MDSTINISTLNDFIFCPKSIYYHQLYGKYHKQSYQDTPQTAGTLNHESIDTQKYSSSKDILQGMEVYSSTYNLTGKIDLFHISKKSLIERKTKINKVYDGYKYQLYAQYYCLIEMGYEVDYIKLYSLSDNQIYPIDIPPQSEQKKFEQLLSNYRNFSINKPGFTQNINKCHKCIYRELCDRYSTQDPLIS
ncbi:MAG TPA: type V CRISPR-associated protein Cas4 [Candidatus Absconditabacterales bacterium]|nr:type V CRISPR-associated protein Cas4 [Candidatus Absconditabacterales bacterium]HNG96811.1 type V CRISPR-associated protein Cas4 [Candidatus Absconditabacterales bacterium]